MILDVFSNFAENKSLPNTTYERMVNELLWGGIEKKA